MNESEALQTLGMRSNATREEIKAAFHKLAHQHHPDKGGDAEKFKKISAAKDALKDYEPHAIPHNFFGDIQEPPITYTRGWYDVYTPPYQQDPFGMKTGARGAINRFDSREQYKDFLNMKKLINSDLEAAQKKIDDEIQELMRRMGL